MESVIFGQPPIGYGSGDGSGYGSGYGDGDGDGYGCEAYWSECIDACAILWPEDRRERLAALRKQGATIAFWRSSSEGRPCNGGSGEVARPGLVQEVAGPLRLCEPGTLHATLVPTKWKGERLWVVALFGEVATGEHKMGALRREIIAEALPTGQESQ